MNIRAVVKAFLYMLPVVVVGFLELVVISLFINFHGETSVLVAVLIVVVMAVSLALAAVWSGEKIIGLLRPEDKS